MFFDHFPWFSFCVLLIEVLCLFWKEICDLWKLYILLISDLSFNFVNSYFTIFQVFLIFTWGYFFIPLEREKGERERNIDVREKHCVVAFWYMPQVGMKPAIWVCALTGNWTHDRAVYRTTLQPSEPHWPGPKLFLSQLSISIFLSDIVVFLSCSINSFFKLGIKEIFHLYLFYKFQVPPEKNI